MTPEAVDGLDRHRSQVRRGAATVAVALVAFGLAALLYGMNVERDPLALNEADNWLHLGLAAVGLWLTAAAGSVARGRPHGPGPATRPAPSP